jgi:hypothetical protein
MGSGMTLSKALATPTPKGRIDTIEKTCPCGNTFEIVTAQRIGNVLVKRKGWHRRKYCYTCLPQVTTTLEYHRIRERMWYSKPENKAKKKASRLRREALKNGS